MADTDYDAQFKLFCLDLFSEIVKTVGWKKADDESHVQVSMLKNFLPPELMNSRNELVFSLAGLSSLVHYLLVRPQTYS